MYLFSDGLRAAIEYEKAVAQLRVVFGQDGVDLAKEAGRLDLSPIRSVEAVMDCFRAGRTLDESREALHMAAVNGLPVQTVLELQIRAETMKSGG